MKKLVIIILLFLSVLKICGQNNLLNVTVKETKFFYKDSVFGEITYGNYEPTGIVALADGSLVISTRFSMRFLGRQVSETYEEFSARQRIYRKKSHIRSGSVFMLNKDREKQWEIFFKDKPIRTIKLLPDETILVAGDVLASNFFWIAKISKEGEILDKNEFRFKRNPTVRSVGTDSLNNMYVLLEAGRMEIVSVTRLQHGHRRIRFFQESDGMKDNIYLLKISPANRILWSTAVDRRRDYWSSGRDLVVHNSDIFVTASFEGFRKERGEYIRDVGRTLFLIGKNGRIKQTYPLENKRIFTNNNQLLFTTFEHSDTLVLYEVKNTLDSLLPIETVIFGDEIRRFWVRDFKEGESYNYIFATHRHNLGCLLIKLDKDNRYVGHWKDSSENISSLVDGVITPNNSVAILASQWLKSPGNSATERVHSIKLIEIEMKENDK